MTAEEWIAELAADAPLLAAFWLMTERRFQRITKAVRRLARRVAHIEAETGITPPRDSVEV